MLNERVAQGGLPQYDLSGQADIRKRMGEELALHADDDTEASIRPQKMLCDLRALLGPEDILLSDVGAHKMWIARHFHCHEPNTCLIPNGFCSMGFALPGAIAANLVFPDRRVVGLAGDAGFLMNVQEMETARRLGSDLVVLVWEDGAYGLIAWKQQTQFGKHTDLAFGNPDWLELARAFSWNGHRVEHSADFAGVMTKALEETGPSLVVAPVDYRENMLLNQRLGELVQPSAAVS